MAFSVNLNFLVTETLSLEERNSNLTEKVTVQQDTIKALGKYISIIWRYTVLLSTNVYLYEVQIVQMCLHVVTCS